VSAAPKIIHWIESKAKANGKKPLIMAHNSSFDKRMFQNNMEKFKIQLPQWQWVDSMSLIPRLYPATKAKKQLSLQALSKELQLDDVQHRASGDVQNLWEILSIILEKATSSEGNGPIIHKNDKSNVVNRILYYYKYL
jgi:DNA polymerase III alpha subunit (gram-positive type)